MSLMKLVDYITELLTLTVPPNVYASETSVGRETN
jgi:hypothetical protein